MNYMQNIQNLRIGFIGAGKAAITLGSYFYHKGIRISGYCSLSSQSAQSAAEKTASHPFESKMDLVAASDLFFISTPDSEIEKVWEEIKKYNLKDKIVCHLSGSLSSDVFYGIDKSGASSYSIHPIFAFSDKDGSIEGVEKATFSIEGSTKDIDLIKKIFQTTGNNCFIIEKEQKIIYHAANVMISNLVTSLISIGIKSLEKILPPEEDILTALMPLIKGNILNIEKSGVVNSLTGPAERNDKETIVKHLTALNKDESLIYALLTKELIKISEKKHHEKDYNELLSIVSNFE